MGATYIVRAPAPRRVVKLARRCDDSTSRSCCSSEAGPSGASRRTSTIDRRRMPSRLGSPRTRRTRSTRDHDGISGATTSWTAFKPRTRPTTKWTRFLGRRDSRVLRRAGSGSVEVGEVRRRDDPEHRLSARRIEGSRRRIRSRLPIPITTDRLVLVRLVCRRVARQPGRSGRRRTPVGRSALLVDGPLSVWATCRPRRATPPALAARDRWE